MDAYLKTVNGEVYVTYEIHFLLDYDVMLKDRKE